MVDPITSNGVTAALRHSAEASSLILKYRSKRRIPLRARVCYGSRILQMAKFFNSGIEKIVYEPPLRNRIGLPTAGTLYTSPAWNMNVVYARLKPSGALKTFLLNLMLGSFRLGPGCFTGSVYPGGGADPQGQVLNAKQPRSEVAFVSDGQKSANPRNPCRPTASLPLARLQPLHYIQRLNFQRGSPHPSFCCGKEESGPSTTVLSTRWPSYSRVL